MNKFTLVAAMASVSAMAWATPDNPTGFKMKFDLNGGNPKVSGSFYCPTSHYSYDDPKPLEKITKVKVVRGCYDVEEFDLPVYESNEEREPGSLVEFEDELGDFEYGHEYSYNATICDENGETSYGARATIYVGIKPGQPAISVSVGENGTLPVTLTIVAPETTSDNEILTVPLTQLRVVEYIGYQNERTVKVVNDPVPGKSYTFTDDEATLGNKIAYRGYAGCEYGESEYSMCSVFVGEDVPSYPQNLSIADNEDGSVTLSWSAPENGKNGGYVNPSKIRYKVQRHGDMPAILTEDLQECTFTDPLEGLTGPTSIKYEVTAYNDMGEGDYSQTTEILRGPAYQLPFEENFNAQTEAYWGGYEFGAEKKWTYEYSGGYSSNWDITSYSYSLGINGVGDGEGVEDSDDDAYIRTYYASRGNKDTLLSSAIDFKETSFPVLTFYHAAKSYDPTTLTIGVRKNGESSDLVTIFPGLSQHYDADGIPEWQPYTVYLTDAVGEEASVYFTTVVPADADDNGDIALDRIIICDYPGVDKVAVAETDGQLEISWVAPKNSYGEEPLSYDVKIDGGSPENVLDTKYVMVSTRADEVASHKIAIRANYEGIMSRFSPEFDVVPGGSQSGVVVIASESDANVEYYDLNGLRVVRAMKGSTLIRRSVKTDGSVKIEKFIVK